MSAPAIVFAVAYGILLLVLVAVERAAARRVRELEAALAEARSSIVHLQRYRDRPRILEAERGAEPRCRFCTGPIKPGACDETWCRSPSWGDR